MQFEFFNASATGFNATVWKQDCDANPMCTKVAWFGYICGMVTVGLIAYLVVHVMATLRKTIRIQVAKTNTAKGTTQRMHDGKQRRKRFRYKLHVLVSVLVYDITRILMLFLGQYGQNLVTNRDSQLYAFGYVTLGSMTHICHVGAHFKTRPMKVALKAIDKNEIVDSNKVNDSSVIVAESRLYLLSQFSLPILFHLYWFLLAMPNDDLNPINFARVIHVITCTPQLIMILIQFVSFIKLYIVLMKMPSYQAEQRLQNQKSRERLKKRIISVLPIFVSNVAMLLVLVPTFGTMTGWMIIRIGNTVLDIFARFLMFRLATKMRSTVCKTFSSATIAPT